MLLSAQVVNAYASTLPPGGPAGPAGTSRRSRRCATPAASTSAAQRHRGAGVHRRRGGRRDGERHPAQRRPALRRPRPPGVLQPRGHQPARRRALGQGRRAGHARGGAPGGRACPGVNAPINLYKNNTDNKGASYGAHENYLCHRATPFASLVRHLVPFFVTRQVICGAGRVGLGQDGRTAGLPDLPARRLLRGRGRAGDHPQAADRQHPRRAARRRRPLPPAARDHRRRQPVRDLDLPQGGHDGAGAGHDRGQLPGRRPGHRPAGARAARRLPRPRLRHRDHARRRPDDHRARAAGRVPRPGAQVRRRPLRRRRRRADRRRARPLGVGADPARHATRCSWPASWTGWPSCGCSRATASATAWTGTRRGCSWSTCSTPTCARRRASTTGSSRAARCRPCCPTARPRRRSSAPPEDTRAYFRGECLRRYGTSVAAASWDSVIFDVGRESLVRVPMLEPLRGTQAHVGELLDRCPTAAALIDALVGRALSRTRPTLRTRRR